MAHQLALTLGYASVSRMLDSMTRQEWRDWQAFLAAEPLEGPRMALLVASIVREIRINTQMTIDATIAAAGGRPRHQPTPTLDECLLRFGDDLPPAPRRMTDWRATKDAFFTRMRAEAADRARRPRRRRA